MPEVATAPKWEYGTWGNFADAPVSTVDEILTKLVPNFDPDMDSLKRKRYDAFKLVSKHELADMAAIAAFEEKQKADKLKDVPAEYQSLTREDVKELLDKSRARVDYTKYGDSETWKLINILHRRIAEKYNGITLADFRQLQLPAKGERAGRAIPVVFAAGEAIPTLAPKGITQEAIDIFDALRAQFGADAVTTVGRNKGTRAYALAQLTVNGNPVRIQIGLPDEYVWPTEAKTEGGEPSN